MTNQTVLPSRRTETLEPGADLLKKHRLARCGSRICLVSRGPGVKRRVFATVIFGGNTVALPVASPDIGTLTAHLR